MFDWINSGWDWIAFSFGAAILVVAAGLFVLAVTAAFTNRKK